MILNSPHMNLHNFRETQNDSQESDPKFNLAPLISAEEIKKDAEKCLGTGTPIEHAKILSELLRKLKVLNFRKLSGVGKMQPLEQKHYVILAIEQIFMIAEQNNWRICKFQESVFLFNGSFWKELDHSDLKAFLGK